MTDKGLERWEDQALRIGPLRGQVDGCGWLLFTAYLKFHSDCG